VAEPGRVGDLYRSVGVGADVSPTALGRPVNQSSQAATGLDADLVTQLRDYFRTSDAALEDLLGRPLPWAATSATTTKEHRS
jgi:hypothetical protein